VSDEEALRRKLHRIDGRGYKAYREIRGGYQFGDLELHVDHVQGDPFAAPSRVRVRWPQRRAALPAELFANRVRRLALADFLTRQVAASIERCVRGRRGSGKSGLVSIDTGAQQVLERTAVVIDGERVEARLEVGLPAAGRRVLAGEAEALLCEDLVQIAEEGLLWERLPSERASGFVRSVENHQRIREQLGERGLVAFVADGAILPRESGASDRPMGRGAVAWQTPESLRVDLSLAHPLDPRAPDSARITGLGIPRGVTLIVGGGYHGKSTLLRALERGVYPHVPGDGRERVVTDCGAVKIRAEDGRRVEACDISSFIGDLPRGRSTRCFDSDDASGSTSQAANIAEAIELGASTLLLDEDTSATNFMVRDARMQALVRVEHEPITPFVDRVRELYDRLGVSTVLVMGGCGDYFDVADTVIEMREYLARDVTGEAKSIAASLTTQRRVETQSPLAAPGDRVPVASSLDPSRGRREVKIDAKALDLLLFGNTRVDLRGLEQLVDRSQTRALGHAIELARRRYMGEGVTIARLMDALEKTFDEEGLDVLDLFRRGERHPGNLARPRRFEIGAALNRLRTLRIERARAANPAAPEPSRPGQSGARESARERP
jgi:predicted ABC-class ATPase